MWLKPSSLIEVYAYARLLVSLIIFLSLYENICEHCVLIIMVVIDYIHHDFGAALYKLITYLLTIVISS